MATGNQWNELGRKGTAGLANLFTGIMQGNLRNDAKENYYEAMKNIKELMASAKQQFTITPKQEDTQTKDGQTPKETQDPLTNYLTGLNPQAPLEENINSMQPGYTPEGQTIPQRTAGLQDNNTAPQGSIFDAYMEGMSKLAGNPFGSDYTPLLTAYYNAQQTAPPKYEYRPVGGTLVRISPDGKVEPVYKSDPKENVSYDVPNDYRIIEDNGKYYFEIPKLDKNTSELKFVRTGEATEDEYLVYQNKMQIGKEKFSDLDRLNNKSLKGGRLGSLKIPELPPTGQEAQLLQQINDYNALKDVPWDQLTEKDQATYKYLNEQISKKTGLDADEVAVDIATERFKSKNKQFNQMESIRERQTAVKSQFTQAETVMQGFIDAVNTGQATPEQVQTAALKWYNDNLDALIPEVKRWVEEQLRVFGVIE
jgi:hypothetical protein